VSGGVALGVGIGAHAGSDTKTDEPRKHAVPGATGVNAAFASGRAAPAVQATKDDVHGESGAPTATAAARAAASLALTPHAVLPQGDVMHVEFTPAGSVGVDKGASTVPLMHWLRATRIPARHAVPGETGRNATRLSFTRRSASVQTLGATASDESHAEVAVKQPFGTHAM